MAKPANRIQTGPVKPFKPVLVVVAMTAAWGAYHQPALFDVMSLAVWGASAVAIGLFAYAALALLGPGLSVMWAYARRTLQQVRSIDFNDNGNAR